MLEFLNRLIFIMLGITEHVICESCPAHCSKYCAQRAEKRSSLQAFSNSSTNSSTSTRRSLRQASTDYNISRRSTSTIHFFNFSNTQFKHLVTSNILLVFIAIFINEIHENFPKNKN